MKNYKPFLEKSEEYIGKFANRDIIDTFHSIDRYFDDDRFNKWSGQKEFKDKIVDVTKKAIAVIYKKHKDKEGRYGVHSKSTGIGLVLHWREDKKYIDGFNDAIIITILPIKKNPYFRDIDAKIIVEKQIESWGRATIKNKFNEEIIKEEDTCRVAWSEERESDWQVIFWEGELHDYPPIDNFILVS